MTGLGLADIGTGYPASAAANASTCIIVFIISFAQCNIRTTTMNFVVWRHSFIARAALLRIQVV